MSGRGIVGEAGIRVLLVAESGRGGSLLSSLCTAFNISPLGSMVGSPDLISIPGETGRMYESNVDDVGYRLVAIYTPVREDGVEGVPVSASTEPILVEPDVLSEVKSKLDLGSVKFEVLCDKEQSSKKSLGLGCLERRILEVNRKRVKVIKPGLRTWF